MSRIVLCDQKLAPHLNFNNFQAKENVFSFPKFFQCLGDKKAAENPDWPISLKFGQIMLW